MDGLFVIFTSLVVGSIVTFSLFLVFEAKVFCVCVCY